MDFIYNWVKNIVFFLILITIINNLAEKSSYKKYISLISGMILIILVVKPLFGLFDIDEKLDYYFEKNSFVVDGENINIKLEQAQESQINTILEEYKTEIKINTEKLLEKEKLFINKFEIKINSDEASDSFGEIQEMWIEASYIAQNNISLNEPIEKVEIDKIEIGQDGEKGNQGNSHINNESNLSENEIYIKNLLSDFYNLDSSNINISIQE